MNENEDNVPEQGIDGTDLVALGSEGWEPDTIRPQVRTVAYYSGVAIGALALLASGLAAIWLPDLSSQVAATAGTISAATALVLGSLGVAYRPTK